MFINSMLLHRIETPFDSLDYLTELKLDGMRLIYSNLDQVILYTRHNND
jgi:DNA ligase 1